MPLPTSVNCSMMRCVCDCGVTYPWACYSRVVWTHPAIAAIASARLAQDNDFTFISACRMIHTVTNRHSSVVTLTSAERCRRCGSKFRSRCHASLARVTEQCDVRWWTVRCTECTDARAQEVGVTVLIVGRARMRRFAVTGSTQCSSFKRLPNRQVGRCARTARRLLVQANAA